VEIAMVDFVLLMKTIVTPLTHFPGDVEVRIKNENEAETRLQVFVNPSDIGRVVGKGGVIANSIRNILNVAGTIEKKHVTLDIDTTPNK
jgi:predicted RNA-binding protein YlqC (UPF0109 family)